MGTNYTKLLQGDCLDVLQGVEENSVDMILTDLPYGTTACSWDSIIPLDKLWEQYNRVAKENAAMVFTAVQPFTTILASSNIENFRYEWIWEKHQGTNPMNAKIMPLKSHENILVFYRKLPVYNPQMTKGKPYGGFKSDTATIGEVYGKAKSVHRNNPEGTRYPKTILRFKQEKGLHPTQKPVPLMKYLIKTYTNEGAVVLDSTMGSGTTGVACVKCSRSFIGIEKDPEYFQMATDRLNVGILNV
ncbi:MAG: site-specific DNA-methyltransferase [Actinomycetota bacterium]|nr:site-specific DNA-methyltransferase [Actinomycetota bacterium]